MFHRHTQQGCTWTVVSAFVPGGGWFVFHSLWEIQDLGCSFGKQLGILALSASKVRWLPVFAHLFPSICCCTWYWGILFGCSIRTFLHCLRALPKVIFWNIALSCYDFEDFGSINIILALCNRLSLFRVFHVDNLNFPYRARVQGSKHSRVRPKTTTKLSPFCNEKLVVKLHCCNRPKRTCLSCRTCSRTWQAFRQIGCTPHALVGMPSLVHG